MPLPFVAAIALRVAAAAAGKIIAKQAATAAARKAAAAAAKSAAEAAAKKAAQQQLGRQTGTRLARDAAKKAAQKSLDASAKAAKKPGGKGPPNTAGKHQAKKRQRKKDPCSHPNDSKKKRAYVVYKANEYDKNGNKIGTYVGRTSGKPGEPVHKILARRLQGHHRHLGKLEPVFETDSYAAVRGAEQLHRDKSSTVQQINPISPKNKRKDDYVDCAKSKGAP